MSVSACSTLLPQPIHTEPSTVLTTSYSLERLNIDLLHTVLSFLKASAYLDLTATCKTLANYRSQPPGPTSMDPRRRLKTIDTVTLQSVENMNHLMETFVHCYTVGGQYEDSRLSLQLPLIHRSLDLIQPASTSLSRYIKMQDQINYSALSSGVIKLQQLTISGSMLPELASALSQMRKLVSLEIHDLTAAATRTLKENPPPHLQNLMVLRGQPKPETLLHLVEAAILPALTSFCYDFTQIEDVGLRTVLPHLNHNITTLKLQYNRITDQGVEALSNTPLSLKVLNLAHNLITHLGVQFLKTSTFIPTLTDLDLSYNQLFLRGVEVLSSPIEYPQLKHLALDGNSLEDDGLVALFNSKSMPLLESLTLSCNEIQFEHPELTREIPFLHTITDLNLEYSQIGDIGVASILKNIRKIVRLNLNNNALTAPASINAFFEKNHFAELRSLNLSGTTCLSNNYVLSFLLTTNLPNLEELHLNYCGQNAITATHLANISDLKMLKHLSLASFLYTEEDQQGFNAIRKRFAAVAILS